MYGGTREGRDGWMEDNIPCVSSTLLILSLAFTLFSSTALLSFSLPFPENLGLSVLGGSVAADFVSPPLIPPPILGGVAWTETETETSAGIEEEDWLSLEAVEEARRRSLR